MNRRYGILLLLQCLYMVVHGGFEGVHLYGINYNSRKGQDWQPVNEKCKDTGSITQDLTTLKTITDRIRIYSLVDCPVISILDAANQVGMHVALGIWTMNDPTHMKNELNALENLIKSGKINGNIVGLHVGSEAIYRKDVTSTQAIDYLNQVRTLFKRYSITTIPLTIADVVDSYIDHPELIDAVDVVSVNQFSFWEPRQATIDSAMTRMLRRLQNVRRMAKQKNKAIIISETGWSSEGSNVNASIASPLNQVHFFKDFYHQAIAHDFAFYYFTSFDTHWRVLKPEDSIEAGFGLFQDDRSMKPGFTSMKIGSREQKIIRTTLDSSLLLSEQNGNILLIRNTGDIFLLEQGTWLFDLETMQVRNKGTDTCLDAYQPWNGGAVKASTCLGNNGNQQWTFNAITKQLKHQDLCLTTSGRENTQPGLATCQSVSTNQQWRVEGPGVGCNSVERDTDYIGNDIGSMLSDSVYGCCALCRSQAGCRAYTWSNYNGGTCWLKSGKGTTTSTLGVHSGILSSDPPTTPVPTPASSCSLLEQNTDYTGSDIGNAPSATAEGCCSICKGRVGCKAFSWTNYVGGTCWLKAGKGTSVSKAGVYSAVLLITFSAIEEDVDYIGNDLSNVAADDASKCVPICSSTSQCMAFTWTNYNGGTCWFKTAKGSSKKVVGARSAYRL